MKRTRPAETAGGLVGVATAIVALAGGSLELVAVVGTAAGLVPSVVTFLVDHGGIRGVLRSLWAGRARSS